MKEDLQRVWKGLRKVRRRRTVVPLSAYGFCNYWFRLPKSRRILHTPWGMRGRRTVAVGGEAKRRAARMV